MVVNSEEEFKKIAKKAGCVTIKKGMPDFLVCSVKNGIVYFLFVEVKSDNNGLLSNMQKRTINLLNLVIPGIAVVWRPEDGNSFLNKLVPIQKRQPGNPNRRMKLKSTISLDKQFSIICHLFHNSGDKLNWAKLSFFLNFNCFNKRDILKYMYDNKKISVVIGNSTHKGGRKPTIFYLNNQLVQIEGRILDWNEIQKRLKLKKNSYSSFLKQKRDDLPLKT